MCKNLLRVANHRVTFLIQYYSCLEDMCLSTACVTLLQWCTPLCLSTACATLLQWCTPLCLSTACVTLLQLVHNDKVLDRGSKLTIVIVFNVLRWPCILSNI